MKWDSETASMDFRRLPDQPFTLKNLNAFANDGHLAPIEVTVANGKIRSEVSKTVLDMAGSIILPTFTDMHTHLDKGHIWNRTPNPDGTFDGALSTAGADRVANWSADDVRRRMEFALKCAFAHGTGAIRTHIDSLPPQEGISWPVFREIRQDWKKRVDLQAACLLSIDQVDCEGPFEAIADIVAASQGVLGAVTYPMPDLENRLERFFAAAAARSLSADFHTDETGDPTVATLRTIAETVIRTGFDAPVVVGHCCSLAVQDDSEADRTMDLVAEAGLNVVSLPMCNLYLQDRRRAGTPRWRGATLVHEMKARGINVSFASDNTRDPFYAYGDLDMVEVLREATRITQIDHSDADWIRAFNANPEKACGFTRRSLDAGAAADFILFNARNMNELLSRPQSDRVVVRGGRAIDRTLPNHSELDDLMETP